MPQRNGQNPIKSGKDFGKGGGRQNESGGIYNSPQNHAGLCPACHAEVALKPGFRLSALKCPKCGASIGKRR